MKVEVGKIVNTHGIKGEIKVKSNSDFTDIRFQPGETVEIERKDKESLTLPHTECIKDCIC